MTTTPTPRDKRTNLDEAVSRLSSGMTIGIGGWGPRRKPMALRGLVYRDSLFPRAPYRLMFEHLLEAVGEKEACRIMVEAQYNRIQSWVVFQCLQHGMFCHTV